MNSKIAEQSRLFAFASFADAENLGKFGAERGVLANFPKTAVHELNVHRISSPPLAAIIFSPQPVQEMPPHPETSADP